MVQSNLVYDRLITKYPLPLSQFNTGTQEVSDMLA